MPRVTHVMKARKANKAAGIKKGDSYYWWKFNRGPKMFSKTPPKRSQLTRSNYLSQLYDIQDELADLPADDSLPDAVADLANRLRDLAQECEENKSNMPEGLQEGDTGQLLDERTEACNNAADELEGLDLSAWEEDAEATKEKRKEEDDPDAEAVNSEGETEQEYWEAKLEEVQGIEVDS